MIYKYIDQINQGEKLGKPIFSSNGQVLLQRGVSLSVGILARLRQLGITALYIMDDRFEDIEVDEVITESTKREAVKTLSESFQYMQSEKNGDQINKLGNVATKLIDEILNNSHLLLNLADIRTSDNELFIHSVNVCTMSVMVGLKLGLSREKLKDLAMGALLHDIGKIIKEVKNDKPIVGEYSDDHTWKGFQYLKNRYEISLLSSAVCLQHHECIDGTGFPRKLMGKDIHLFAKIVSVTNYYDNLISGRNQKEFIHPYEAGERILGLTNTKFDYDVVWAFFRCIAFYPTGSQVRLTNQLTGVVVGQNNGLPQRPIIRVLDVNNRDFTHTMSLEHGVKEINLAQQTTLFIEKLIC